MPTSSSIKLGLDQPDVAPRPRSLLHLPLLELLVVLRHQLGGHPRVVDPDQRGRTARDELVVHAA
eukprot:10156649-Heterocapsa_arctica.AAC.1